MIRLHYLNQGKIMNNKDVVDIVVLIDKSMSMHGMEEETIGAFNGFLKEQLEVEGEAVLTLILFDHEAVAPYFRVPLNLIEDLTLETYQVRGSTAMYDAIGSAIEVMNLASQSNEVIFLIQSDGQENCSKRYGGDALSRTIAEKEKLGWDFQFIGTGIDAIKEGSKFGMRSGGCASVLKSAEGFDAYGATMTLNTTSYRTKSTGAK